MTRLLSKDSPARLGFFDTGCQPKGIWDVGYAEWALADVSVNRGLIALLRKSIASPGPFEELLVADPLCLSGKAA